jgi:exopolysaccharide production protein ExoQ
VTLTGRTELWAAVLEISIPERPWLGYGYDSFWVGWEGPSGQIWHATNTRAAGAQNGILDLWLQLGLLGIVVFAVQFLRSLLRAVAWARHTKTAEGLWPLVYLTYFVLYNITQNIILVQNSIYWILYTSTVLSLLARRGMYSNTHHLSVTSARAREIQIPGRLT